MQVSNYFPNVFGSSLMFFMFELMERLTDYFENPPNELYSITKIVFFSIKNIFSYTFKCINYSFTIIFNSLKAFVQVS